MSRREMPAEHAILGLLAMAAAAGAGYGYDLAKHFADGEPLAEILRLEPGMLYHHLKKLERAGWVEGELATAGARPPRRLVRLTPAGRAKLDQWLQEPVTHTREIRLEFLVKLYFARRLHPARVPALIAEQRAMLWQIDAALAAQRNAADGSDLPLATDQQFLALVMDLRRRQTQAAEAWLESVAVAAAGWEERGRQQ